MGISVGFLIEKEVFTNYQIAGISSQYLLYFKHSKSIIQSEGGSYEKETYSGSNGCVDLDPGDNGRIGLSL
jgi:hypothetical protein